MSLAALFSGSGFKNTVQRYCNEIGWRLADISDSQAKIAFSMSSGRSQTLWIIRYDTTLEFSVPSMAIFNREEDLPGLLSNILLQRNSQRKVGFWCVEKIGGKYVYSCMHNAEMSLLDRNYFETVVRALVKECDDFEGIILNM
jgi:hypothetical protein